MAKPATALAAPLFAAPLATTATRHALDHRFELGGRHRPIAIGIQTRQHPFGIRAIATAACGHFLKRQRAIAIGVFLCDHPRAARGHLRLRGGGQFIGTQQTIAIGILQAKARLRHIRQFLGTERAIAIGIKGCKERAIGHGRLRLRGDQMRGHKAQGQQNTKQRDFLHRHRIILSGFVQVNLNLPHDLDTPALRVSVARACKLCWDGSIGWEVSKGMTMQNETFPDPMMTDPILTDAAPERPLWPAMARGLRGRCPHCGKGSLFSTYLTLGPACGECGENLSFARADDGPAYLTILIVGKVLGTVMLWVYIWAQPSPYVMAIGFSAAAIALALVLLPVFKGMIVAIQWAKRMHGF